MSIGFTVIFQSWSPGGAETALGRRLAEAMPATLILIALALGPQIDDSRKLWWPALLIGDASYSLYLIQEFLLRLMSLGWHKTLPATMPLWLFIPIGIAVAVTVAVALFWYFERPVTRWLNGVRRRPVLVESIPASLVHKTAGI